MQIYYYRDFKKSLRKYPAGISETSPRENILTEYHWSIGAVLVEVSVNNYAKIMNNYAMCIRPFCCPWLVDTCIFQKTKSFFGETQLWISKFNLSKCRRQIRVLKPGWSCIYVVYRPIGRGMLSRNGGREAPDPVAVLSHNPVIAPTAILNHPILIP